MYKDITYSNSLRIMIPLRYLYHMYSLVIIGKFEKINPMLLGLFIPHLKYSYWTLYSWRLVWVCDTWTIDFEQGSCKSLHYISVFNIGHGMYSSPTLWIFNIQSHLVDKVPNFSLKMRGLSVTVCSYPQLAYKKL